MSEKQQQGPQTLGRILITLNSCQASQMRCPMSSVICQLSSVTCQVSPFRCPLSGVICHLLHVRKGNSYQLLPATLRILCLAELNEIQFYIISRLKYFQEKVICLYSCLDKINTMQNQEGKQLIRICLGTSLLNRLQEQNLPVQLNQQAKSTPSVNTTLLLKQ